MRSYIHEIAKRASDKISKGERQTNKEKRKATIWIHIDIASKKFTVYEEKEWPQEKNKKMKKFEDNGGRLAFYSFEEVVNYYQLGFRGYEFIDCRKI